VPRVQSEAYVLLRSDFQETSRIVTLFTRTLGRVGCLAKGAYRDQSPLSGAIDLLLLVDATVVTRNTGLHLLQGARVLHNNLGFLRPRLRLGLAEELLALWLRALPEGRADQELFDLFKGGMILVEHTPVERLPQVRLALELRFLRALGLLAEVDRCSACGEFLPSGGFLHGDARLVCARHRGPRDEAVPGDVLGVLASLLETRGRDLPRLRPRPATLQVAVEMGRRFLTQVEGV
jgi:DNA repair protein RecO (recombination protein O)